VTVVPRIGGVPLPGSPREAIILDAQADICGPALVRVGGAEMAVSWDISTGADTAACGALSAGLGKPALRFGATVKRDGITTTAKQASNATVASMFPGLK
jgi:hypothetical protein